MLRRREGPTKSRQTGYYYFDNFIGFPPNKKRVRFSLGTKDPAKAQWLWEQEYKKQWSEYYGLKSPEKPKQIHIFDLFKEFIEYQRDVKHVQEWRIARSRLQIIHDFWGNILLNEINSDRLVALDNHLRQNKRSDFTINHYFSLLKTVYNYAIKKAYCRENPINEIKPYIVDETRRDYSPDEIRRILEAAERIEKEARANAIFQKYAKHIILLLIYTGMRLGEVLNLRWDNIKEDRIVLKRTETKQKKEKVIPLTGGIGVVLEGFKDRRRKDGYVLPLKRRGGKAKAGWANSVIRKVREYSGVKDFIFHNLRHTASTIMVSEALGKGVGLADIMKILGHSNIETTQKYMHSDFERMKKAVEILEEKTRKP